MAEPAPAPKTESSAPVSLAPAAEPAKPKAWSDYVAISTAVLAVVAALTAAQAGAKSSRSIILQSQESDQWSFYQAKSIKEHTYELQAQLLGLLPPDAALDAARQVQREKCLAEADRYEKERGQIKADAEKLKAERADVGAHGGRFAKALIALQISIVLSSVSGLTKKRWLYLLSLALGAAGVVLFGWGYLP